MYSDLRKVLINPELKSGVIIAPSACGRTTALAHKAILSALEGGQVLVVATSLLAANAGGGFIDKVECVLEELGVEEYRLSPNSSIITIGEGKIKVADLDFVLDKQYDLVIYLDGLDYDSIKRVDTLSAIICMTHYQLLGSCPQIRLSLVKEVTNMRGEVSKRFVNHYKPAGDFSEGTVVCKYSGDNNFVLEVREDSDIMKRDNPVFNNNHGYRACVNAMGRVEKIKSFSTSLDECYEVRVGELICL